MIEMRNLVIWNVCVLAFSNLVSGNCGRPQVNPNVALIVGGKAAQPYSWPWQVAIFKYGGLFSGFRQWCGGSLIANQWVLTAAHCVNADPFVTKYKIKLGVYEKGNNVETGEVVDVLEAIIVHPNFDPDTTSYDVALLRLSKPISYTDHIAPICLPFQNEPLPTVGSKAVVTGWGLLETGGSDSSTLQEVVVPLVDIEMCKQAYPGSVNQYVMFCAGPFGGGKDSCNGDSGGPLVYYNQTEQRWEQIGIVSWGDQVCGKALKPGVYSKVSAYIDWIKMYTNIESFH